MAAFKRVQLDILAKNYNIWARYRALPFHERYPKVAAANARHI